MRSLTHLLALGSLYCLPIFGSIACVSPTATPSPGRPWARGKSLQAASASKAPEVTRKLVRTGTEIVIAGKRIPIGVPVVLWNDAGGYNAYGRSKERANFARGRQSDPRESIDQFVLHYDVCGVSRECFRVLEARGLSVHFLLDIDGTLYQTLDLAETAWHAREANARSIGVEIANIGAYPRGSNELATWYAVDGRGPRITVPRSLGTGGVKTNGFIGRPARHQKLRGEINGQALEQYDFTPEQYETLAHLTAALVRYLPNLDLRFPTEGPSRIRSDVMSARQLERYRGILGHQHISASKTDPGPSFNWAALARRAGELLHPE